MEPIVIHQVVPLIAAVKIRQLADAVGKPWPILILHGNQRPQIEGTRGRTGRSWGMYHPSTMKIVVGEQWLVNHHWDIHVLIVAANHGPAFHAEAMRKRAEVYDNDDH